MRTLNLPDIIGPIMVGPSSSHTAGALRIASMTRRLLEAQPVKAVFTLYGSFSQTYQGHGTDRALVAGLLGLAADDLRIRDSFDLARRAGLEFRFVVDPKTKTAHPNTVDIKVWDQDGNALLTRGESIGGGAARITTIDGHPVELTGESGTLILQQRDVPGVLGFIASTLGNASINIGSVALHRTHRGGIAFNVLEVDSEVPRQLQQSLLADGRILRVRYVPADAPDVGPDAGRPRVDPESAEKLLRELDFADAAEMLEYADRNGCSVGDALLAREEYWLASRGTGPAIIPAYLRRVLEVMRESATGPLAHATPSMGGLIGGEARALGQTSPALSGVFCDASTYAIAVLETNATMGRIVAAPTAGAAGVLPGVLFALQRQTGASDEQLMDALAVAAAVGYVVSRNATVAGAEGGCQAEIGTAAGMAAAAATHLLGGTAAQTLDAAAIALTNMMGLVCDPVGGLVEEPCQKRNASGAANALTAAQLALAGIHATAPLDETVDAMRRVGNALPYELRETALGGIATCPSCLARQAGGCAGR